MSEDSQAKWYVVHTYSGYENKVKANIEKIVGNRAMENYILEVSVPMTDVVEIKNGVKKTVSRKVFPGYVLIKMIMDDDTWYIVRNTRGVTSFVGPGSKPVALTEEEIISMGLENFNETIDLEVNDAVKITSGSFENTIGKITEVNNGKKTVVVMVSIFGRETPVELDFMQVIKLV